MKSLGLTLLVIVFSGLHYVLAADDDPDNDDPAEYHPEIVIEQSVIRGRERKWDGKAYWSFKGIRFAQPPLDRERFQTPTEIALPPLTVAYHYGNSCLPIGNRHVKTVYHEDCLFLNVFCQPMVKNAKPKAVIVFIHGGGNIFGSVVGWDGASLVVHRDVITVTINYRLGPLGFLSTEDSAARGNAGLFDQTVAITWVKRHIKYFGGDPYRITLMGESSGGKSASIHTISPYTRDLVRRAIMLSGTAYGPAFYAWAPKEAARVLAQRVKCPTDTSTRMVQCLRQIDGDVLMKEAGNLWTNDNMRTVLDFWWGAVRDNDFIPSSIEPGVFKGDVLISNTNNEGSVYYETKVPMVKENDPDWTASIDETVFRNEFINQSLYQYFHAHPNKSLIDETFDTYVGKSRSGLVDIKTLMNFFADQQFIFPSIDYLDNRINQGDSYLYYFDRFLKMYDDKPSFLQGSHHSDDKPFILGHDYDRYTYSSSQRYIEDKVSEGLQIYVTNFAKTGNPNKPIPVPVHFSPYHHSSAPRAYLHVTGNTDKTDPHSLFEGMRTNLLPKRLGLWSKKLAPALRGGVLANNTSSLTSNVSTILSSVVWIILLFYFNDNFRFIPH